VTILVDRARWLWRGERWSHLASDRDLDELHDFATRIGVRRLAFQGDHYDLPQRRLADAIDVGAELVDSRDLVRRLREAGLRHRRSMGWQRRLWWEGDSRTELTHRLAGVGAPSSVGDDLDRLGGLRHVVVLQRPAEWGIGVTVASPPALDELDPSHRRWVVSSPDGHHVDWFVADGSATGS
jgi:hypothetical protein